MNPNRSLGQYIWGRAMKNQNSEWIRPRNILGAIGAALVMTLTAALIVHPAISEIAGLAVAQSSNKWNNVRDAAVGDSLSSGVLAMSPYMFNGLTFDRVRGDTTNGMDVDVTRISGSITPADAYGNPTTANQMWSLNGVFNGTTWDRQRSATADALTNATGLAAAGNLVFNGVTWDRSRGVSANTNATGNVTGIQAVAQIGTWSLTANATAGTPSASRASGGGTVRHVVTTVTVCVAAAATAQPAVLVHLRDGATGAGTILRSWALSSPVNDSQCDSVSGLNITGSAATAMTIEFAAATAAGVIGTVNASGYDTP